MKSTTKVESKEPETAIMEAVEADHGMRGILARTRSRCAPSQGPHGSAAACVAGAGAFMTLSHHVNMGWHRGRKPCGKVLMRVVRGACRTYSSRGVCPGGDRGNTMRPLPSGGDEVPRSLRASGVDYLVVRVATCVMAPW